VESHPWFASPRTCHLSVGQAPRGFPAVSGNRVIDTLQDFRMWLDDFSTGKLPSHDWLYQRVERALAKKRAGTKIAVRGLMRLGILIRINP
jgi:hypothetical protein